MKTLITTIAAAALMTIACHAEEKPPGRPPGGGPGGPGGKRPNPEEMFKKLDSNNDGSVSLDEFKAGPRAKQNPDRAQEIFGRSTQTRAVESARMNSRPTARRTGRAARHQEEKVDDAVEAVRTDLEARTPAGRAAELRKTKRDHGSFRMPRSPLGGRGFFFSRSETQVVG